MNITRQIVQMPSGKYVKNWQYSQGFFDVVETEDALEAMEIDEEAFMVFFMEKGAISVTANISIDIVPMSGASLEVLKMRMVCARQKQKEEGEKLDKNESIFKYL